MSKRKKSKEFNFDKGQSPETEQSSARASLKNFGVARPGRDTQATVKPADLWDLSGDEAATGTTEIVSESEASIVVESAQTENAQIESSIVSEDAHSETTDVAQIEGSVQPVDQPLEQASHATETFNKKSTSDSYWSAPPQFLESPVVEQPASPTPKKKGKRQSVLQQVTGQALPSPQQPAADSRPNIEFEEATRNNKTVMIEKPNFEALQGARAEAKRAERDAQKPTPSPDIADTEPPGATSEATPPVTRWLPPPRKDTQSNALPVQKPEDFVNKNSQESERQSHQVQQLESQQLEPAQGQPLEPQPEPETTSGSPTEETFIEEVFHVESESVQQTDASESDQSFYETVAPLIPPSREVYNVHNQKNAETEPPPSEAFIEAETPSKPQRRTIVQEFDISKLVRATERQTVEVKKLELEAEAEPQFDSAMHYFTAAAERMTYTAELRFRASYTPPEKKEVAPPPPEAGWNRTDDDMSSGSNNNTFGFKFLNDFVPPRQDFPAAQPRSGFNMLDLIDEGYRTVQPNPTFSQTRGPGKVEVAVDWVNSGGKLPPSSREGLAGGFGGATKAPVNQYKKNWLKNK